ncbi:hypothetical protein NHX12_002587 [Muraenolepis orangiensis]|uniref:lysoplasmalogenase n=1 Tax=Muraenolepis orangiensis TaxID=630683 RepID=A0A9Q0DZ41_9TELE|nr:hypothetical protein NHX12_002587 [Muraenolepis orangiensis]
MEKDFQSAPKRFWQTIRRLRRGKRGSIQAVYSKGGTLLTSSEEVIGRWKEHFEELLNPTTPSMVKSEGPKLLPFFKATCVYCVLWLPTSSPSWFSALIKCLLIFCLWVFLLAHGLSFLGSNANARKILADLVFWSLGDVFLIWQEQGYFSHGLLMFAITNILYSSAFSMRPLTPPRAW